MLRSLRPALLVMTALFLAGCAGDDEVEYVEQSVYDIYTQAIRFQDRGQFTTSALFFEEVERQHPYSIWATKAKLMAAHAYYQANKYDEAIAATDRFIAIHPGNPDVAYAYYLKALCYYERITDVKRDQELTFDALRALEDVIQRFPQSEYARDARLKIDLTRDHLAGKEMNVGRFYLNRKQHLAALNRFKVVIDEYGTTSHVPEALYRMVESYTALGLSGEAQRTASVLGHNYPGSDWYGDAYRLVTTVDATGLAPIPEDNTGTFLGLF